MTEIFCDKLDCVNRIDYYCSLSEIHMVEIKTSNDTLPVCLNYRVVSE